MAHIVEDVSRLVRQHDLSEIALVDSNFLVDTKRAVAIAQGFLEAGLKIRWTFQASTDLLCRMSDSEVQLLGQSGVSHIGFGTESASPEVLKRMNKPHQHIPDMFEAARKCAAANIRVTYNLIFGFPGEDDVHQEGNAANYGADRGTLPERQLFSESLHALSGYSYLAGTPREEACGSQPR